MLPEIVEAIFDFTAIYYWWTEERPVKLAKGNKGWSCLLALTDALKNLRKIKGTSSIIREVKSWKEKLDTKYSEGQTLDKTDSKKLSDASWKWYEELGSVAQELDKEQRTLESIEERMKNMQKGFTRMDVKPVLEEIEKYMSKIESATMTFVESSPTERSLEPTLRGLLNRADSGELMLTGYFDQYLLADFQAMSPTSSIKFISPELSGSKQDRTNLDALKRLQKMGAEIRFHPMLHARMILSPTEIIVGSADVKSDCLGGRRYDAGIWSNNPVLVRSGKVFVDKVWSESKPLS